ncbi:hypothetical protein CJ010_23950 [Azoarcus sp. DD4]|uniref:[NiFe]-hydrogenase assembly chaperone HybE n=1 Tax=Azoarcus sp. DD4 TaxID=2027405 RepID=UPI00112A66E5|nr:[NiFe]-hydrogenase assembly chaperone HybE [Azoarcus sp. DD4]QDF99372.1 hypothetical protein CJ010_23950 [Azoarcus sp. DD4]
MNHATATAPRPFAPALPPADRVAALHDCFAAIAATRMAGLPLCNPALAVAVPAMQVWEGEWLGVLVTPWAISLVLLPGPGGRFREIGVGESQEWAFPSGTYEFLGNREEGLGAYQSCSLASPVFEFASQDEADAFARAALAALLEADAGRLAAQGREDREAARLEGRPTPAPAPQPLSRRAFLRGALFGAR